MIPKIIHYCWLSDDPYPEQIQKYIDAWKVLLPDYEFIKWDFNRIDKSKFKWVSDAFDNKRYAFAADFIRVYALYNYGGIYLDTDVEVLKSFDDLLHHKYFFGHEYKSDLFEAAVIGAEKGHKFYKEMLDYYEGRNFVKPDGSFDITVLPRIMMNVAKKHFEVVDVVAPDKMTDDPDKLEILPYQYFSPKAVNTGKVHADKRTYAIHQFSGTWLPGYYIAEKKFWESLHIRNLKICLRIVNLFKHGTVRGTILD